MTDLELLERERERAAMWMDVAGELAYVFAIEGGKHPIQVADVREKYRAALAFEVKCRGEDTLAEQAVIAEQSQIQAKTEELNEILSGELREAIERYKKYKADGFAGEPYCYDAALLRVDAMLIADAYLQMAPTVTMIGDGVTELMAALTESVKLQSHYAELLNGYDGGERIGFADADAWIERLAEVKRLMESTNLQR